MQRTLTILKDYLEKEKEYYINNAIIVYRTVREDSPVPDTESNLKFILELNEAISVLENQGMAKNSCDK
jgi:hypothetical protein